MPIPATSGPHGLLPAGAHSCSLGELEQEFVALAPYPDERRLIFDAFTVWLRAVGTLFPGARCWVDGGFVTWKTWAPPTDIDVTFFVKDADVNGLDARQQATLQTLLTSNPSGGPRVQPMGGMVDGYMSLRSIPDRTLYWRQQWSRVKAADGSEVQNVAKGFLEVIA